MRDIEAQAELAVARAILREERRMKSWTSEQYPQETLDKVPTEDKIDISDEYNLWEDGEVLYPVEPWRELASEERLLLYIEIIDMVPEEQLTDEVREAISEAIFETERRLCEPR